MMCTETIYLYKHSILPVMANILKQSIQSCAPLVNKQFAPGFNSDLMTVTLKQEQIMQMRYTI